MNITDSLSVFNGWANIGVCHYLVLALILFLLGLFLIICTRNLIKILIGIEFMLNAVCINFAAINSYVVQNNAQGQVFGVFILALGAISIAVGLSIVVAIFYKYKNIDSKNLENLKEEGGM